MDDPREEETRPLTTESAPPDAPTDECEVCGTEMYGLHCKIVCPNCGYKRDCSDP